MAAVPYANPPAHHAIAWWNSHVVVGETSTARLLCTLRVAPSIMTMVSQHMQAWDGMAAVPYANSPVHLTPHLWPEFEK